MVRFMNNMEMWDNLKRPPSSALKTITGGRLRGFTDVNPQWRYRAMTEQFGVCGMGWKYTIEKLWLEPVGEEICAFAAINLFIKVDGEWSAPIPGVGGSMLVAMEKEGPHVSDEAYKMAITDALSVAMKLIGVAADVYEGFFDGSKYKDAPPPKAPPATKSSAKDRSTEKEEAKPASEATIKEIVKLAEDAEWEKDKFKSFYEEKKWKPVAIRFLSQDQANVLLVAIRVALPEGHPSRLGK